MRTKIFITMISFFLSVILITGASAFAGSDKIKTRMKERLPVINALKAEGVVGENNKGYLEFIGGDQAKKDVINAENSDRRQVYTAIAKQQGTSVELVGKRRAKQIVNKAKPGQWIQDQSGQWYQKK
ncbi:MAG: YdbL family protein [Thermodesulfobacteriota bacterium]|nr:YdbL family protein [Thermodesulfobacteriota bacterium]